MTVALLLSLLLLAQAPPSAPPLSDLEQAQMRAVNQEVQRVNALYELAKAQQEKADLAAALAQEHLAQLKAKLEAARPGWSVDMATGQWTKKEAAK